ncbi:cupin domain-containing protein [Mycolicibacterium sp. GCM10028919]|uniref:cupin domain-containing protein n=1 Tax=Mycolicibacterium sp. GCM10028919 TaxID=3273401 RepID=UPI0036225EB1
MAAVTALAVITAAACVYEAGISRADSGLTDGVTRLELQRTPAPTPGFDIVQTRVEIPVGKRSGRHSHPGPEIGYVVAGQVDVVFDDRPAQNLHTGDPFLVPAGVIHDAVNVGDVRTMMLSTYVVPAGQPLVASH